ncbi:PPK2 family polyphosphate kinase [Haliscomenobacter hydrossis]|uniref:Polyphosphate:nucleotide phosphotransferase, PPK2 family n=1 Tax=Haliscomenobacter hydrossis (strain ATCC 27775 / DSM 1100 / LMG 10767 / O) TaxID=760192 RepID=F4KVZ5_HALH1|nr:PPK2 family polyphosphate kinase [Haliscomenobacter hydrossis]AEE48193.1 polyphosphate:nucleotide phosphotransferase, PPK2 family [Haliscomenobacter hydrossis DSM 1100]
MIKINDISADAPADLEKSAAKDLTKEYVDRLGELQSILTAQKKYSVLVILQGMDGSGKDGATANVFKECHPNSLQVVSFKKPTEEEFAQDFLWRVHKNAPPKGMIHIFNRSQYEDVIIQRVHKWIDEDRVKKRIASINAFEELLAYDNNTIIFKFMLHISKEQQEVELNQRLNEKEKFWKHNASDWREREHWDEYMRCYEDVLNQSSIPWTVVPVDQRWYRDYVIAKAMVEKLETLDLAYPPLQK